MSKLPFVLLFTAMTAFFWGIYGIVLHKGTSLMELKEKTFQGEIGVSLRAFVGVGLAYFLIAVLVPVALLNRKRETGFWSVSGTVMSLFAGTVGALGALGVTLALAFKAQAIFVMPIVFGGAPVVNTLLTSYLNKSFKQIKPMFLVGMAMVALGMIGVFLNKPQPKAVDGEVALNWLAVGLSIGLAVLCWGSYGPFLHIGQSKMGGSRLRPFCCVGIAYFLIAVIIPVVLLESMAMHTIASIVEKGKFDSLNAMFAGSLLLGILGAVTVLLNAPKSAPHGKPAQAPEPASVPSVPSHVPESPESPLSSS